MAVDEKLFGKTVEEQEKTVAELALTGLNDGDIALLCGCGEKTLLRRFSRLIARKRAERRKTLYNAQNELALSGNATILIWLGKVELEQTDKKPKPEPYSAYLEAMDLASAEHDSANPDTPRSSEE